MSTRWPLIIGGVAALIGACLSSEALSCSVAQLTLRDADGFYTSPSYRLSTDAYAVVLDDVDTDLGQWVASPVRPGQLASIRVTTQTGDRAVFAGIARPADVTTYLADVAHEQVVDVPRRR